MRMTGEERQAPGAAEVGCTSAARPGIEEMWELSQKLREGMTDMEDKLRNLEILNRLIFRNLPQTLDHWGEEEIDALMYLQNTLEDEIEYLRDDMWEPAWRLSGQLTDWFMSARYERQKASASCGEAPPGV
jgi:hypothetical protein